MLLLINLIFFVLRYSSVYASDCLEKPHCGVNEVWDCLCLPRPTCDDPCGRRDGPHVCPLGPDGNCVKECICKPGFVRGSNGLCTHCTQCTPLDEDDCCDDEEFQSCGTFCPETCASREKTVTCTEQCVKGCFCRKGHVRDINGICVDPEECPGMGGSDDSKGGGENCKKSCNGDPNAHPGCGVNCGRTCATFKNPLQICPRICMLHGCDCNDGFIKDENLDKCVKPNDCTPICSINETFSQHPVVCPPKTCDAIGKGFACPANTTGVPACICKDGYLRNKENKCVLKADCASDCPKGEIFKTCGRTCSPKQPSCDNRSPGCNDVICSRGCYCPDGFMRKFDDGPCIRKEECPNSPCQGDGNAEWITTPVPCAVTCQNKHPPKNCEKVFGCKCKNGLILNEITKKCVDPHDCPSDCPKGEIFKTCGRTCSPKQPSCDNRSPGCNDVICSRGCYCPDGFMRKFDDGPCIKKEECPNSPCQGDANAEWITTPVPCAVTCQNNQPPKNCSTSFGCKCKNGLILDEITKKCIDPHNCPIVCPEGEVYKPCGPTCSPKPPTCDNRSPNCNYKLCTRGCFCPDKYVRKFDDGPCIKIEECPNSPCQGDENAEWITTPVPCAVTCQNKNPPKNCSTTFGCKCKDGLLLDEISKKCVKPDKCPAQCGPNQHLDTCPVDCPSDYCPTKDEPPVACSAPNPCPPPKCKCNFNFKKDKNGICIPTRQCPPFKCPVQNEVFNPCPPFCPSENCADSKLNGVCPYNIPIVQPCNPRCRCIKGYFRNNNNVCIPASGCPSSSIE